MLVKILLFIKHHFKFLWSVVDCLNALIFRLFYYKQSKEIINKVIKEYKLPGYVFRNLEQNDLESLRFLVDRQKKERLTYFNPHGFEIKNLVNVYLNPSFIMMGVFNGPLMIGYFFLRCFWNRKCFVGRLIDEPYEGKGIGRVMNSIMYNIGWNMGFRVFSTISKNNHLVMKSHSNNPYMKILKELDNDYLLVEFIRSKAEG